MIYGITILREFNSAADERITRGQGLSEEDRYVRDGDRGYVPQVTDYAGTGVQMIFKVAIQRVAGVGPLAVAVGFLGDAMTDALVFQLPGHRVNGDDMSVYLDEFAAAIL